MASTLQSSLTTTGSGLLAVGLLSLAPLPAHALGFGTYRGLRLDGLLTGNQNHDYTFDFDHPDSEMWMTYEEGADYNSLRIFGTAFGGLDIGTEYDLEESGLWEIDFTYDRVEDHWQGGAIVDAGTPQSSGTITLTTPGADASAAFAARANNPFNLVDVSGAYPYSFGIFPNVRNFAGLSGLGWLNHEPTDGGPGATLTRHMYSSDWLFTVGDLEDRSDDEPPVGVPEPGLALVGLTLGLGVLSQRRH
jgi:hypothetical protein